MTGKVGLEPDQSIANLESYSDEGLSVLARNLGCSQLFEQEASRKSGFETNFVKRAPTQVKVRGQE